MAGQETIVAGMTGRYATALFQSALDAKALDQIEGEIKDLASLVKDNEDLNRLVTSPVFTNEAQASAIAAILDKAGIKGLTANFMGVLANNRRLFAFESIAKDFLHLAASERGEVAGEVVSAHDLSQEQVKTLTKELKSIAGRDVTLTTIVDPSILGGLIVKLGATQYDNSLKSKLNRMKKAMKEVG